MDGEAERRRNKTKKRYQHTSTRIFLGHGVYFLIIPIYFFYPRGIHFSPHLERSNIATVCYPMPYYKINQALWPDVQLGLFPMPGFREIEWILELR